MTLNYYCVSVILIASMFFPTVSGGLFYLRGKNTMLQSCPTSFTLYAIPESDITSYSGSAVDIALSYKSLSASAPSGNFVGVCEMVNSVAWYCSSAVLHIDQFYDKNKKSVTTTGECPGSVSLENMYIIKSQSSLNLEWSITGGKGTYYGAKGTSQITSVSDSNECPLSVSYCFKVQVTIQY